MNKKSPKGYKIKPKYMHTQVVKNIPESRSMKEAILKAGYSEVTASKPTDITNTKGFQKALELAGLDIDTLNSYLAEDLAVKKQNRFNELQLAYKLHGKLRDTKEGDKTLILNITGESANRYKLDHKDVE